MKVKETRIFGGFMKLLDENGPTLCTVGSVACLIATVYFAYKAAKETAYYQDEINYGETFILNSEDKTDEEKEKEIKSLKVKNAIEIVCANRWTLIAAGGAAGFAFASNYLNGRKIAGLAAALALSEEKLKKGMAKAKEILNSEEYQKIINGTRQEMAKDDDKAPFDDDSVWDGTEYYDTYVGHFIKIPETQLLDAINTAERLSFIKWNDWRGMLGFESANMRVGWGPKNRFKAHIGQMQWRHNKWIKTIEYDNPPVPLG